MSSRPGGSPAEILGGVRVAPSILSADFGRLREQVGEVLQAGARVIHVDVMDGHFVPPITLGPRVVEALALRVREAGAILDVHLMIERPERQVAEFVRAGAHSVTFHAEATPHIAYTVDLIRESGACVGLALNPATAPEAIAEVAGDLDLALCMTVNPGWGGQAFIRHSLEKLPRMRATLGETAALEVDGGVEVSTAPGCLCAGANVFVAGSAVFGSEDPGEAYLAIARSVDAD
jgi:ribulose-phosphate 3-epimerase